MPCREFPTTDAARREAPGFLIDPDLEPMYQLEEKDYERIINRMTNLMIGTILCLLKANQGETAAEMACSVARILADYDDDVVDVIWSGFRPVSSQRIRALPHPLPRLPEICIGLGFASLEQSTEPHYVFQPVFQKKLFDTPGHLQINDASTSMLQAVDGKRFCIKHRRVSPGLRCHVAISGWGPRNRHRRAI